MASTSVDELREALRENLDRNGTLKTLKAKMRASIYQAIGGSEAVQKPELSSENLIINELIREYLIFNNYRETLSVFIPETGQPEIRPFDRSFLTQHLNMPTEGPNSKQLPLLYSVVASRQAPAATSAPQSASAEVLKREPTAGHISRGQL